MEPPAEPDRAPAPGRVDRGRTGRCIRQRPHDTHEGPNEGDEVVAVRSGPHSSDAQPTLGTVAQRVLFGSWPSFPRSPQPWYEMLAAQFDVDGRHSWDGWATRDMAYEIAEAEQELAARARGDAAGLLAVRRAALTLYHEAAEVCDDSYGGLGDVASEAISLYVRADWRASGIASRVLLARPSAVVRHGQQLRSAEWAGDRPTGPRRDQAGSGPCRSDPYRADVGLHHRADGLACRGGPAVAGVRGGGGWSPRPVPERGCGDRIAQPGGACSDGRCGRRARSRRRRHRPT